MTAFRKVTPHIVTEAVSISDESRAELDAVIEAGLRRYFEAEDRMIEDMRAKMGPKP